MVRSIFLLHVSRELGKKGVRHVIDIGAHKGEFAKSLRRVGYRHGITSIEPMSESFEVLRRRSAGDAGWKVARAAIGSEDGEATLHVAAESMFSSLRKPSSVGSTQYFQETKSVRDEKVPLRRLDTYWGEVVPAGTDLVMLKTDTQGNDLEVMRGCRGYLDQIALLQMEVASCRIYEGVPKMWEVLRELDKMGFELVTLSPVAFDKSDAAVEFDCLWRRR